MYVKDEEGSRRRIAVYAERARASIGDYKSRLAEADADDGGGHGGGHGDRETGSVREAMHRGRHIVVKTHYEITVDGEPFDAHLGVGDDGSVHYHGLPNYAFASMIDLVRKVIDASDAELPEDVIGHNHGEK